MKPWLLFGWVLIYGFGWYPSSNLARFEPYLTDRNFDTFEEAQDFVRLAKLTQFYLIYTDIELMKRGDSECKTVQTWITTEPDQQNLPVAP